MTESDTCFSSGLSLSQIVGGSSTAAGGWDIRRAGSGGKNQQRTDHYGAGVGEGQIAAVKEKRVQGKTIFGKTKTPRPDQVIPLDKDDFKDF